MDDAVAVQVGQGQINVVGDVDLDVVGEGGRGSLQEPGQALLHHLHQENGSAVAGVLDHTEELDDAGMLQSSQDVALLVETSGKVDSPWVVVSEEDGVKDLGGTGEVVQSGLDHTPIGACPKDLGCVYVDILVAKLTPKVYMDICY